MTENIISFINLKEILTAYSSFAKKIKYKVVMSHHKVLCEFDRSMKVKFYWFVPATFSLNPPPESHPFWGGKWLHMISWPETLLSNSQQFTFRYIFFSCFFLPICLHQIRISLNFFIFVGFTSRWKRIYWTSWLFQFLWYFDK